MQKILPHLWFDKQAKEAVEFYVSVFPDSKITNASVIKDTPSGDCDFLNFEVIGYEFMAISAGPYFKLNPAISFMVNFDPSQDPDALARIDEIWAKLAEGGKALMPLDKYPFSERYGWIEDKFGVTWQLIFTNPDGEPRPKIMPALLFTKEVDGKALEATDFYLSVFKDVKRGLIAKYPSEMGPALQDKLMFTDFQLENQWFVAMDGGPAHEFAFNEAISLLISCDSQEEIDYFTEKLSAVPEAEQCGWIKDKYGVAWQIHPKRLEEMMASGTPEQVERVTRSFLQMKRFNIAELERAYKGE